MYIRNHRFLPESLVERTGRLALAVVIALTLIGLNVRPSSAGPTSYNWPQFGFDQQHSGNNTLESKINLANVNGLTQKFQITLGSSDYADGAPAYLSNVTTKNGVQDLLFITTKTADLIALDAQTGAQLWKAANPAASTCKINDPNGTSGNTCYTTSSPAIDPNHQYVYTYGLDGKVHKYAVGGDLSTGNAVEITTGGWPEVTTLKGFNEKGSSALSIATDRSGNSYLYVANGGYPGDNGDYQGHITAINLATGAQNVFNTLCSNNPVHFHETPGTPDCASVQSAVWSRPGTVYNPDTDKLYIATGNGDYNVSSHNWGDSVLALNSNGMGSSGNPIDAYTPTNFQSLQNGDTDLGSTAPAILPANGSHHYGVQGGKDGKVRILNMDNLSGASGFRNTGGEISGSLINIPTGGEVKAQPAIWTNPADGRVWVFVATDNGLNGLLLNSTGNGWVMSGSPKSWSRNLGTTTSPIVANGVLFAAYNNNIVALDPTNGTTNKWSGAISGVHWESPIVANGILYMLDNSKHLTAFWLGATATFPNKNVGIYNNGAWWLRNSNGTNFGNFGYGASGWIPVVGDWDGDGIDSIGIYKDGAWYLLADDNTTLYASFSYGGPGWLPVVGDWNGSGATRIGIYQNGAWYLRNNLSYGPADYAFFYGAAGWLPVTGRWNGSNRSGMGIYKDGAWYLRNNLSYGPPDYAFGYGAAGWLPVTGDWLGNRQSGMGIYQNGAWYLRNSLSFGPSADYAFSYGAAGWTPVVGDWNGPTSAAILSLVDTTSTRPATTLPPTFQPPTKKH